MTTIETVENRTKQSFAKVKEDILTIKANVQNLIARVEALEKKK